ILPQRPYYRLVVGEERREHVARRGTLARALGETREPHEFGERGRRGIAERPHPLRNLVDRVVELLVLRLEELVQVVELRADDVPVVVACLRVEDVLVRE